MIPDDVMQSMDITALVAELNKYQVSSRSSFGQDVGKSSFEYLFFDAGDYIRQK